MKRLMGALALASVLAAATPMQPGTPVTRAALRLVEKKLDSTIPALDVSNPYDMLGMARGIYLPGYGAIFTTELNLVFTIISPLLPR